MRAAPSREEVRRHNLGTVLRYVHVHGATSRAELTTRLGLNRSTIGALTADLTAAGLVSEGIQRDTGRAGRPSLIVRPQSAKVHAYALSIEVDRLRAARVGLGGRILDRREVRRPPGMPVPDALRPLGRFVREMRREVADDARCVGTGVAVTGRMRHEDGTARVVPRQHIDDLRESHFTVGNHADVSALAEHNRGAAAGYDNVLYLYGDIGVSAGILAAGRGAAGRGGEVGHVVVNPFGRSCPCGSRGCWETEIGEHPLLTRAGRSGSGGREAVLGVVAAAARGESRAESAVREIGRWIGFGVGNLANIVNPEVVIFGGTLGDVYRVAAHDIRGRFDTVALPACREHIRLRTPALGDDAALIGAAELAFEQLLGNPTAHCSGSAPM